MGTAAFAVPSLEALCEAGYPPIAVVTGPDKPRGRGQRLGLTPVKEAAFQRGLGPILQPEDVKDPAFAEAIGDLRPDILVVVAFRILPPAVYTKARLGAINLHGSLLPRYRGAAPIHRAVMAGERETGVTTFFLAESVDTGAVILQRSLPIGPNDTTGEVHDRLMHLGAEAVIDTVRAIAEGTVTQVPQRSDLASAAPKIFNEDGEIVWSRPAAVVHNQIRGLSPHPGAWTLHGTMRVKVFRSEPVEGSGSPGEVIETGPRLVVACGDGAVSLLDLQLEGRRRLPADAFVRGYAIACGDRLGAPGHP
jgi:methionyl-tRNA formyltransferase